MIHSLLLKKSRNHGKKNVGTVKEVGWYFAVPVEEVEEPRKKEWEVRSKSGGMLAVECCTYRNASTRKKERMAFVYVLVTSVSAERSFSVFKLLLGDKMHEFEQESIEEDLIM
jgi:hypothetical protein